MIGRIDPPVIRREPVAGLVVRGRSTELSCEADGNPPITYEWYKVLCLPVVHAHLVSPACSSTLPAWYRVGYCGVLFRSLAVLDPRVGHTMDALSPFIPVLCHSN